MMMMMMTCVVVVVASYPPRRRGDTPRRRRRRRTGGGGAYIGGGVCSGRRRRFNDHHLVSRLSCGAETTLGRYLNHIESQEEKSRVKEFNLCGKKEKNLKENERKGMCDREKRKEKFLGFSRERRDGGREFLLLRALFSFVIHA